jgi:hypothetical protein
MAVELGVPEVAFVDQAKPFQRRAAKDAGVAAPSTSLEG